MIPNRLHLAVAAVLAALGAGVWIMMSSPDGQDHGTGDATAAAASRSATPAAASRPAALAASAPTTVEEAARLLELGASGDLTVDMNTRGALDVLLASLGPAPGAADFQRLEDALRRSMPGEAATQAIALVRRYDAYHRAAAAQSAAQQVPSTPEDFKRLQDEAMALRRQHFDADTARALFGAEEEQTRLDMAMNAIQADPRLSAQDKATQIAALRQNAPRDLPVLQSPAPAPIAEMEAQLALLRQQGAAPAQIDALRQRYLGVEAASALREMEAQQAQWETRYQAYLAQKQAIVASGGPDTATRLDQALREHFKEEELAAARAYDRNRTP